MRVEITKAAAAALILEKLAEGKVTGGAYYHDADAVENRGHRDNVKEGNRCSIGWLFSEDEAKSLESRSSKNGGEGYLLARQLTESEWLVTDDDDWFTCAQQITDHNYTQVDLERQLGDYCRAALPTLGYDIGNRRSSPAFAS